jgi:carbohydrate diacid regulator
MTLPIVHEGAAMGTVGITGPPAQARRFGLVVKRQTEILLEEAVLLAPGWPARGCWSPCCATC